MARKLEQEYVEECYKKQETKKLKTFEKIIQAEHDLYRNAKLMNLRQPFLNQESIDAVNTLRTQALDSDRSIETAMNMLAKDGMVQHIWDNNIHNFFGPFYTLKSKEKEFEESLK